MKLISDVELISAFSNDPKGSQLYTSAIESMKNIPRNSALSFRYFLEWTLRIFLKREKYHIEIYKNKKPVDLIDKLFTEKIISYNQKDTLHRIRMTLNTYAHLDHMYEFNNLEDVDDKIREDCIKIRKEIISVLREHYEMENNIPYGKLSVSFEKIDDIDIRELIFNAIFSDNHSSILEAAMYCELDYKKKICKHTTTEALHNHKEWVFEETMPDIILSLYKSAVFNSSTLDQHCGDIAKEYPSYEVLESSDPECLYRYAMFLLEYYDKDTLVPRLNKTKPFDLLSIAACNGSVEAEVKLGKLQIEEKNIEKGLKTLNSCMNKGSVSAVLALAQFYENNNIDKAIHLYEKAFNEGVPDALAHLSLLKAKHNIGNKKDCYHTLEKARDEGSLLAHSILTKIESGIIFPAEFMTQEELTEDLRAFLKKLYHYKIDFNKLFFNFRNNTEFDYILTVLKLDYFGFEHDEDELKYFASRIPYYSQLQQELNQGYHDENKTPSHPIKKAKIGVNEQCPCGSGKKYKKCCRMLH
ncbi:TPA: SEC-C metal-binding domain-containing protein [Vibrio vulnificus]